MLFFTPGLKTPWKGRRTLSRVSEQYHGTLMYPLKPVVPDAEVTIGSDTDLHEVVKKTKQNKNNNKKTHRPNTPDSKYSVSKQTRK